MAKTSGLGATVSIDDSGGTARDISNDITDFDFSTPREEQDTTGVDKSARERLLLLADFSITVKYVFNPAANQSFDVFKTVASTSVARTVTITVSSQILPNEVLFTDAQYTRAADGSLVGSSPGVLSDGVAPTWTT